MTFKGDLMNNTYERVFTTRTSDFDMNRQIKPSAVLDLFQEVAGAHANELEIGFEHLIKKQMLWMLVRVKYEVLSEIKMHQEIKVKTWPLKEGRVTLERDYLVKDKDENPIIKGTSQWVLVHSQKRHIIPTKSIYPLSSFNEERMFEKSPVKLKDFTIENDTGYSITPEFCDIDMNGHVNNIRYADFVLNAVNLENQKIKSFQLDFSREIKKDTKAEIFSIKNDNVILAKGTNEKDEKLFSCEIELF